MFIIVVVARKQSIQFSCFLFTTQRKYGKIYKNAEDEAIHKAIYLRNMREIEAHNIHYRKGELPYWKEENEFTDLTEDEFRQYYRSIRVTCE